MDAIMAIVMPVDGKLTKGNDPKISTWAFEEDTEHLSSLTIRKYKMSRLSKYKIERQMLREVMSSVAHH